LGVAEEHLREFAAALVKEKDFKDLDQETMEMLVSDVYDRLEERVNAAILASLPPEKVEDLEKLLDTASKEELSDFCERNIPNLQEVITEALISFKQTYLGA